MGTKGKGGSKGSKKPPQKGIKEKQLIQEDEEGGIGQVAGSTFGHRGPALPPLTRGPCAADDGAE